jgi:Zn-finger nucleic acid-binding protein
VTCKLSVLDKVFAADGLARLLESAKQHQQSGCICPDCGASMSILKVASGKSQVEIDVCGSCRAVWYDKNEFETLVPNDGVVLPKVTTGKAFRREMVLTLAADLRNGHLKVLDDKSLQMIMKRSYHVPQPDIAPIISTLKSQKIIHADKKTGCISILPASN